MSHADIWQRILRWLKLFEGSPDRSVKVRYVKAHNGEEGNERADALTKMGADLRRKLSVRHGPDDDWIGEAMGDYWSNRTPS